MNKEYKEREVLDKALDMFRRNTGLTVEVEVEHIRFQVDRRYDALIRIAYQDIKHLFAAEIKNIVTRATIGGTVQQLHLFPEKGLLIARYITPQIAEELKKMDIPFIDTAGNAYINEPPLFIFIKGNKLNNGYHIKRPMRAFRPAGLQVVFALLCNPGLENAPYRDIAEKAMVALGTVCWTMDDLKRFGYFIDIPQQKRKLINREGLLQKWVNDYPVQLRPKKVIGRYRADDWNWWRNAEIKDIEAFWGSEVAANILTEYLKPQIITVYTNRPIGRLLLKNKIKQDPRGNIEILNAFWNFETKWLRNDLVPPLLIYADLLATGDARNIETARVIYERELNRFIRED